MGSKKSAPILDVQKMVGPPHSGDGVNRTFPPIELVAHHEAGHGVVHVAQGHEVRSVQIDPDTKSGKCSPGPFSIDNPKLRWPAEVLLCLGGPLAAAKYSGSRMSLDDFINGGDKKQIRNAVGMYYYLCENHAEPPDPLNTTFYKAQLIIAENLVEQNWCSIQAVAAELLLYEIVPKHVIERIYNAHSPQCQVTPVPVLRPQISLMTPWQPLLLGC